jgi:hypothetical protein
VLPSPVSGLADFRQMLLQSVRQLLLTGRCQMRILRGGRRLSVPSNRPYGQAAFWRLTETCRNAGARASARTNLSDCFVTVAHCSSSGGAFHPSALARQTAANSRRTCSATASMLRRPLCRDCNAPPFRSGASALSAHCVDQFIDILPSHQLALPFHDPDLQHLGFRLGVLRCCLRSCRPLLRRTQVREILQPRLILIELAICTSLDHALSTDRCSVPAPPPGYPNSPRCPICENQLL